MEIITLPIGKRSIFREESCECLHLKVHIAYVSGNCEQVDLLVLYVVGTWSVKPVGMWSVKVVGMWSVKVVGNEREVVGKSSHVVGMWSVKADQLVHNYQCFPLTGN